MTVYSASLSAGFEFLGPGHGSAVNSTLRLDSNGGLSPNGAFATATTLTLPSPIYVFDLESTIRCPDGPCGQAVVPGTGAEYFRLDTADGRYDEVEIKVPFPLQLADAGVQLLVPRFVNAANDTAAQVLTGTAENSSTVTIYDNGNFVGSTAADSLDRILELPHRPAPEWQHAQLHGDGDRCCRECQPAERRAELLGRYHDPGGDRGGGDAGLG